MVVAEVVPATRVVIGRYLPPGVVALVFDHDDGEVVVIDPSLSLTEQAVVKMLCHLPHGPMGIVTRPQMEQAR